MNLKHVLDMKMQAAFAACGYEGFGFVTESKRPDLCQFQSNDSFRVAKETKKAPQIVATEVIEALLKDPAIKDAEFAAPGFINFNVTDAFLVEQLSQMTPEQHYGIDQVGSGKRVVMDYGGPNVAKPLHVGHLRSAVIGEALKRIARASGFDVISDIHMGDWGLPMGLVILELKTAHPEWACFQEGFEGEFSLPISAQELNEIYPKASARSKEDEAYRKEAQNITAQLQNGHVGYFAVWKDIVRLSIEAIKKDYQPLSVDFEYWYGESDAEPFIPKLMETLETQGLLLESEGAKIVEVLEETDKKPMPPVIVEKSDGSSIYATTDLAFIIQRAEVFKPQEIWYVVDKRQHLHFEQVFRVSRKAHLLPQDTELKFLGFGTMNGEDGKPFKTRDGGVMSLAVLLETAEQAAAAHIENKADAIKIGVAALKFGDLINHPTSDYVFDIDKFLAFEGKTGSYILYNNVRIQSILSRFETVTPAITSIYDEYDRNLALTILKNPTMIGYAIQDLSPHYVAESTYQIASSVAKFYAEHNISQETDTEKQSSWLGILKLAHEVMESNLAMLGIDPVSEM